MLPGQNCLFGIIFSHLIFQDHLSEFSSLRKVAQLAALIIGVIYLLLGIAKILPSPLYFTPLKW